MIQTTGASVFACAEDSAACVKGWKVSKEVQVTERESDAGKQKSRDTHAIQNKT